MAFEFGQIGNMDETAMTFDMAGFRTVNKKGDQIQLGVRRHILQ